jgi:serine/threonine protein phosphatase PrpC
MLASKSRAGNSPGGARKTNQDSFISITNILGLDEFHIFGVFDGHGNNKK